MRTPEFDSTDLTRLKSQLHGWRSRQTGRPRLPASLWQAAALLARVHGVSGVARSLRLGYHALRRRAESLEGVQVARSKGPQPLPPTSSGFVELRLPPALADRRPATIEVCGRSHRRLRLELEVDAELCVRLIDNFWRAQR